MNLNNHVTLMGGEKVHHSKVSIELLPNGKNDKKIKAFCIYCKTAYTERPFICRCSSNAFIKNVVNGNLEN